MKRIILLWMLGVIGFKNRLEPNLLPEGPVSLFFFVTHSGLLSSPEHERSNICSASTLFCVWVQHFLQGCIGQMLEDGGAVVLYLRRCLMENSEKMLLVSARAIPPEVAWKGLGHLWPAWTFRPFLLVEQCRLSRTCSLLAWVAKWIHCCFLFNFLSWALPHDFRPGVPLSF